MSSERLEPGHEDRSIFWHLVSPEASVCHSARQPRCTSGERRGSVMTTASATIARMSQGTV